MKFQKYKVQKTIITKRKRNLQSLKQAASMSAADSNTIRGQDRAL